MSTGDKGQGPQRKQPLYRKVNTRARGVHHGFGGDFREQRAKTKSSDARRGSMGGSARRGLDYTPLFRFLLSKVGGEWEGIFREAKSRLDRSEPIFWLVALEESAREPYVCVGESSYFSGLFVDEQGLLQRVDPSLGPESLEPSCACCTHTFNGVPFTRRYTPRDK
ncbi:MAG: hypothetical protein R3B07_11695 [Polyangiaceae bacterium]